MNRGSSAGLGATRGKLALIGVLVVVLVCVLASNFRGSAEEPAQAEAAPGVEAAPETAPSSASDVAAAQPASPFGEFADAGDWPAVSQESLVSFDPLAAPRWLTVGEQALDAAAAPDGQTLEELQQAANAIIFVTGEQRVALIGAQEYHVGDMIGRYRISDISSAGIVLSEPTGDARDP